MSFCCEPLTERVIAVDAMADPVTLTIARPIIELAQNHCFRLLLQPASLILRQHQPGVHNRRLRRVLGFLVSSQELLFAKLTP
jgi:hypothetical protein